MRYVQLPYQATGARLPFYLAMEEYLAQGILADGRQVSDDCFFTWQVEPTVIFGRNQDAFTEVNIPYCREHGISFYRRKSGGGCVYADMDNVMMSYITTRRGTIADTFSRYTAMLCDALRELGLDARESGRNDIEIEGMKVSGNAFYHTPKASIAHGTLLYDSDMEHISRAITPTHSKLQAKGVTSVPSRITTIRRHIDISLDELLTGLRHRLCDEPPLLLSDADVEAIRRIALPYYDPEWIYGSRSEGQTMERERHIDPAGHFLLRLSEDAAGHITSINLSGDFFALADTDEYLLRHLQGVERSRPAIENALRSIDTSAIIRGLSTSEFINLIIS